MGDESEQAHSKAEQSEDQLPFVDGALHARERTALHRAAGPMRRDSVRGYRFHLTAHRWGQRKGFSSHDVELILGHREPSAGSLLKSNLHEVHFARCERRVPFVATSTSARAVSQEG